MLTQQLESSLAAAGSAVEGPEETRTREVHTLSVFRKEAGRWLLARDVNL